CFEPRIFRELLCAVRPSPFVVVEDDKSSRHHSLEQRVEGCNLRSRFVEVDMQIGNLIRRLPLKGFRYEALDYPYLRIISELIPDPPFKLRTMLWTRVMQHPFLVLEHVVQPECLGKCRPAKVVDNGLHAHTGIGTAFYEVAIQLNAMIGGARQYIASPYDGPVGGGLDVALPSLDELIVIKHRVVAPPREEVVCEMHTGPDMIDGVDDALLDQFRVVRGPDGRQYKALDFVELRRVQLREQGALARLR